MNNDLISIIIPVYNVEKYISKCLNTSIRQTYKNIEIIVVNDGSTDKSGIICDEFAKEDPRIKVIHTTNKGVSSARNLGIREANGKYITFIDSDDYVNERYIEILYNLCKNEKADIGICGTMDVSENEEIICKSKIIKKTLNYEATIKELLLEKYFTNVIWAKMYKKEIFCDVKFNLKTKIGEDLELLYQVIKRCKIINVDTSKYLYYYRRREGCITSQRYNENWKREIEIVETIINDFKNNNSSLYKYAIKRYIRINVTCINKIIKTNGNNNSIKKLRDNIIKYKDDMFFKAKLKEKIQIYLIVNNLKQYIYIVRLLIKKINSMV